MSKIWKVSISASKPIGYFSTEFISLLVDQWPVLSKYDAEIRLDGVSEVFKINDAVDEVLQSFPITI